MPMIAGSTFCRFLLLVWALLPPAGSAAASFAPAATLEIRVTTSGRPTAARVYITDEKGEPQRVPGAIAYIRRNESHSVIDGSAAVELAPGRYTVRAEKGPEFRSAEQAVELAAGDARRVALEISRRHDMNARGWYSGDLHIHRAAEEMPLLARAEELNVAPVIQRHIGGDRKEPRAFPSNHIVPVDGAHFVSLQNQEVERLYKGHGAVVLLNVAEPVEADPATLFPLDVEYCRRARRQGGFVDAEKPIWKNVPINVALGAVDAIGIVNNHFHPRGMLLDAEKYGSMERDNPAYGDAAGFARWMMDLYYSFLNCGFRIPVSAGSASGVMPSWPGYERVYVRVSVPFSYEQWFRDLRAGRSVATNGPLLGVSVNDRPPGAEFPWTTATKARVRIEVHSNAPLERLEIVFNGDVVRALPVRARQEFRAATDILIGEPGWLAVRCFEPASSTIRYAHSSPFYFARDGRLPIKRADAQRWADYVHRLAATVDVADYPSPREYDAAQAVFREAEQVYRRLAGVPAER